MEQQVIRIRRLPAAILTLGTITTIATIGAALVLAADAPHALMPVPASLKFVAGRVPISTATTVGLRGFADDRLRAAAAYAAGGREALLQLAKTASGAARLIGQMK